MSRLIVEPDELMVDGQWACMGQGHGRGRYGTIPYIYTIFTMRRMHPGMHTLERPLLCQRMYYQNHTTYISRQQCRRTGLRNLLAEFLLYKSIMSHEFR